VRDAHGQQLTHAQLDALANRLAHELRARGHGTGSRIGVVAERRAELLVALLAVQRSGAAYLPLDPRLGAVRCGEILTDAGVSLLLCPGSAGEALAPEGADRLSLADAPSEANWLAQHPATAPEITPDVQAPVYVIYTSGSTGKPKGVVIPQRGLVDYCAFAEQHYYGEALAGSLVLTSPAFDLTVPSLYVPLLRGGCVDLLPDDGEVEALAQRLVDDGDARLLRMTPGHVQGLLALLSGRAPLLQPHVFVVGGEAFPVVLAQALQTQFPAATIYNHYGPTETVVGCCLHRFDAARAATYDRLPIGRPMHNTQLYVLDAQQRLLPQGMVGELCIGGAGVALGYLDRAELTAEKFIADPFAAGATLYRSGDRVRWRHDGELEFVGRADDQVKLRGFRIELGEIEQRLRRIAGIADAAVIVRGEGTSARLCAYLAGSGDVVATAREALQQQLPDYMVPASWNVLVELPRTRNGKLDRRALPEPELVTPEAAYAAPRNAIEETLCRIWAGLLRVERVGIYDNFFAIGGDSILSIQAVARANQAGIRINTRQVFKHQTVAALAAQATQAGEIEQPQQAVVGELDLLPAQRRFFALGATDAHHYNQCVLLRAPADFDAAALAPVARALFERHDGLRLVFAQDGEHWQARHRELDDAVLAAAVVSETAPAGVDAHEWITARCAHWQQRFDLANGPLLRLIHLDVPGDARLFVLAHHLIVDGISWRLLLADIESAYTQWRQGTAIALAAKTTSLQQWSRALAAQATSATLAAERSYWLAQLALPHESLRGAATADVGDAHAPISFVLGSDETEALLRRCATQFGAPVSELLLAALYVAARRWSGVNYLRVALESHGREPFDDAFDVSETLGWFTTIHPLTLHADDAHPITALKAVKQQYRAIPRHGIGYAVLRYLAGDAAFAKQAAAQEPELLFNYLGQFDQVVSNESTFALAPEGMGEPVSARRTLRPDGQVLACNCIVSQGKLHAGFKFDERVLSRGAIAQLTEAFAASLRELVALSAQPSVHAWTTADFPLARVEQHELDRFVASHPDLLRLYPATPMQQGMLFHSWLDKTAYLSQRFPQINGALDTQAFHRAWQTVIDRHDAFRTAFVGKEGEIHQLVLARAELPWHEEDWRGLSAEEQNQRFADYRRADQQRGFELSPPPLTRVALFRLADERYQLLWTNHHALTDGWSSPLVFRDMVETYRALVEQRTPKLAQPPVYERYIEWLQRQDAARARDWWRELLADVDAPTALPLDVAGERRGEGYAMRHLPLGAELARTLQALARRHRTTVNTVLQLAWGYLLHRHSNDARVVFGSTVSGRPAEVPGVEDMVGLFINTLPVRVAFDREARIATLIERLQDEFQRSNEHGFLALPEIQQQSQVPAGTPLFDSVIVFENYPVEPSLDDNGRSGGASKSSDLHTNFRLTLVASLAEEFDLHCSYALNDYGAETIDRLLAQLADVLRQLAGGCERLEDLRIDGADRAAIDGWNATAREWPPQVRVQALFEAQARARPDALAVADAHERLSYAELDARANRVAQWLRAQGAGRDSVVAVCTDRSVQMLVGLLGALKADAAYVPLDPEYPADRLRYMLEDSGARQLVTLSSLRDTLPLGERAVLCLDDRATLEHWPAEAPAAIDARRSDDLAYVIYTSGSTGQPKGVLLAHGGALNLALNQQALFDVGQNSRVAQFASLSFDAATWDWLMALSHGASLHVCSAAERQSPALLADWLVRERITHATLPPALLPHLELERDYALDALIVAGEACEPQTAWRWAARVPLYNAYGPTEATVCASVARVVPDERITIGAPLANVRLHVLDAQGREQPVGAAGELHIAGEGLARGYRGREDLTNAAFVASARDAGERRYRSGDLARWLPDGRIEFLGRRDDQVKIRGFRIELGEIESALLQLREPRLREAAVIAAPTAQGAQLVAFVVAESAVTNDETTFITAVGDALAQRLPQHLLPTRYVKLDQLPLTASGKVDRKALRVPDANTASAAFVAPSTETERALAQIWSHLLSVPVEQIGTQATFFELGGNSLAMIRLQSAIRQHLGVEVSAPKLFERPTLARLAELIDGFRLVSGTAAASAAEGAAKPAASDDMIEETF
jgi:amino acid adenylation domain-containing protein/non-ribosomal peptide synthase protein (TIGR01720 family)